MITKEIDSEHKYIKRSCLICDKLQECHTRYEIDTPVRWCDKAKYGCVHFVCNDTEIMAEKPGAWRVELTKKRANEKKELENNKKIQKNGKEKD